jgi:hypothetical protein
MGLVNRTGLDSAGIIGLVDLGGLSLIGIIGVGLFALAALQPINHGLVGSLVLPQPISHVGSSTLADCWIISLSLVNLSGISGGFVKKIGRVVNLSNINGISGHNDHRNGLISLISLVGLSALFACWLIGHISLGGLIDHNGLVSFIGLGIVGFIGLSLNSLGGLGHICLVGRCIIGLIELAASSNHWPISLICDFGLCLIASSASAASLARRLISFVGLIGSSTHRLFCERLATAVNETTKIRWLKHTASHKVTALRISANKIVNASTAYYAASLLHICSFLREKMCRWLTLAKKRCGCGLPLFANPTTVTCYNLQNTFFFSVFHK